MFDNSMKTSLERMSPFDLKQQLNDEVIVGPEAANEKIDLK
jgi:hypothetical protein